MCGVFKMNDIDFEELIDDDDEAMESEDCSTALYSVFVLLHFPPYINPLGDANSYFFNNLMGHVPRTYLEICEEQQERIYNELLRITSDMSVFERKYFLKVLSCNIDYRLCKPEQVCMFLTGSLNIETRRELCKHAFEEDFMGEYLERFGDTHVVRKSVLSHVLGKYGLLLYEGVKRYGKT